MKTIIKYLFLSLFVFGLVSNVSAKRVRITKEKNVGAFSELEVSGNFDIILVESDKYALEINAINQVHENLKIKNSGDKLNITLEEDNDIQWKDYKKVYLTVYFKDLKKIIGNGKIKIHTKESLILNTLEIEMNGTVGGELALEVEKLSVEISGTVNLDLLGKAKNADLDISGAGSLYAYNFIINDCEIDISGVASAKIHVKENLDVDISGVAKVLYKGEPDIKTDQSFLSKIKKVK